MAWPKNQRLFNYPSGFIDTFTVVAGWTAARVEDCPRLVKLMLPGCSEIVIKLNLFKRSIQSDRFIMNSSLGTLFKNFLKIFVFILFFFPCFFFEILCLRLRPLTIFILFHRYLCDFQATLRKFNIPLAIWCQVDNSNK